MFNKIHMLKVYTGDIKSHEYMTFLYNKKKNILIESLILFVLMLIIFALSKFVIYMLIPVMLTIYNLVFVYTRILRSNKYNLINSSAYRIKQAAVLFFYRVKELETVLKQKKLDEKEINKWKNYYVNKFKATYSYVNFKQVTATLEEYIASLTEKKCEEVNQKTLNNFENKLYNNYVEKYFEELPSLISQNKIDLKINTNYSNIARKVAYSENVEKALRTLGLSSNTKSIDIVTERYYFLAKKYHPDHLKTPDANKKLMEINKAYRELKNFFSNM